MVVLIAGLLASIALPQYFKAVEKSRATEAFSGITSIKSALERYRSNTGVYTDNLNNLDITYPNLTTGSITMRYCRAELILVSSNYRISMYRHTDNASVSSYFGDYGIHLGSTGLGCTGPIAGGMYTCQLLLK